LLGAISLEPSLQHKQRMRCANLTV